MELLDNMDSMLSALQKLSNEMHSDGGDEKVRILNVLLTAQLIANTASKFRSEAYEYAGERIEKSEKIGDYTVSKVTYKPVPEVPEDILAQIRADAPEVFDQIAQPAEQLTPEDRKALEEENAKLMERAREINEKLHRDDLYLHPELKEKFQTGTGAEELAALLRTAGSYDGLINSWKSRSSVFRLVQAKRA